MSAPDSRGKRGSKQLSLKRIRPGVWSDGIRRYYFNETSSKNFIDEAFSSIVASITGTTDQITVTDNTDGTVTLSLPQSIATDSDVTFNTVTVASYTRHIQIPVEASGTVANQAVGNTVGTAVGLQFASTPDKYAGFQWEVPDDWVGGEDITIELDWTPDSGAMSGTDTVQWVLEYRSIAEGELLTQGSVATVTVTNDDDNAQYLSIHSPFTITYDHADQPLTKQDHVFFLLHRNTAVANDFAGTVTVTAFEVVYNSNTIPKSN
jgi:hypothetical protein